MSDDEELAAGTPDIIKQLFGKMEIGELCDLLESAHKVAKPNVEGCGGSFTCPYVSKKSSGSSNVVHTWIYSDDTHCRHSYAVRIGKKDITVYSSSSEKDKLKKLWNFYWNLDEDTKTKVRQDLRQYRLNPSRLSASVRCGLGKTLNCPVYTNNSSVCFDALSKLATFAQSYVNWSKLSESGAGVPVFEFKFIKDQGKTHLCIIMGKGYSDLQSFFRNTKDQLPPFKPDPVAKATITKIYKQRLAAEKTSADFTFPLWDITKDQVHGRSKNTLTNSDVLIAYRIMEQFDKMHAEGILCFDIKPGNLLLDPIYNTDDEGVKRIVNWKIYIIDLDADWCDNIVFDSKTMTGRRREKTPKEKMVKVFLANQFFKHVGKNIFCQWFINIAYDKTKKNHFEVDVPDELCDGGDTSFVWKKIVSHYLPEQVKDAWRAATGCLNRISTENEKMQICKELYDRMLLNCYYINQDSMDADNKDNPKDHCGNYKLIKSPFGLIKFVKGICRFFGLVKSGGRKTKKRRRKKTKKHKKRRNNKTNCKRKSRKRRKKI
jgi:hypothetical protein